jgi:hypothetical protein
MQNLNGLNRSPVVLRPFAFSFRQIPVSYIHLYFVFYLFLCPSKSLISCLLRLIAGFRTQNKNFQELLRHFQWKIMLKAGTLSLT